MADYKKRLCKCGSGKKFRDCCLLEARELFLDIKKARLQLMKEIREDNERDAMDMATPDVRPLIRRFAATILTVIAVSFVVALIVGRLF